MIALTNLPMPPSVNHLYVNVGRRRCKSQEYLSYQEEMRRYWLDRRSTITSARKILLEQHRDEKNLLIISADFWLHKKTLFSKEGKRKAWDISNRIKALHDAISALIGIDDRYFAIGNTLPIQVSKEIQECVMVTIQLTKMVTLPSTALSLSQSKTGNPSSSETTLQLVGPGQD